MEKSEQPVRVSGRISPARGEMRQRVAQAWSLYCARPCEESFASFYEGTKGYVFTVCLRVLGSEDDAADVFQTVYAHLLTVAIDSERVSAVGDVDEFVRRLAVREADALRKRRDRRRRADAGADALEELGVSSDLPRRIAEQQVGEHVARSMAALPEELRLPLVLHYYEELTYQQVAEAVGVSRSAVVRLVEKGLRRLEESLRKAGVSEAVLPLILTAAAGQRWFFPPEELASAQVHAAAQARMAAMQSAPLPPLTSPNAAMRIALRLKESPWSCVAAAGASLAACFLLWNSPSPSPAPSPVVVRPPSVNAGSGRPDAGKPRLRRTREQSERRRLGRQSWTPLPLPGQVRGRLLSFFTREPLGGVPVLVEAVSPAGGAASPAQVVAQLVTGSDGRFAAPSLSPGDYRLRIEPPQQYAAAERKATVAAEGPGVDLADILLRRPGIVRGQVLRDGKPVANEKVWLGNTVSREMPNQIVGPDGRYEFRDLSHDNYALVMYQYSAHPYRLVLMPGEEPARSTSTWATGFWQDLSAAAVLLFPAFISTPDATRETTST